MDKLIGYESEIRASNMLSVQVNLLNECTSKCKSCRKYTWPKDILDYEDVINTLHFLRRFKGLRTVVFSGGDPILYNDLDKLISFCNTDGIYMSIITTMITDDTIKVIDIAENMYRIHISLDAADKHNYLYIRGVDGFDSVNRNIKTINTYRPEKMKKIRLSSTISVMNVHLMKELYYYAKDNNCDINFYYVHTFDNLSMDEEQEELFRDNLSKIIEDENNEGNIISNARFLLSDMICETEHKVDCKCYVPHISCVINANGDVYPCCRVFKDNGYYGEQVDLAYGNICGKTSYMKLSDVFTNRFSKSYPIPGNKECEECGQRYYDLLTHLDKIKSTKREPLFI